jgi:thiamine biosynthesis lipoprotein
MARHSFSAMGTTVELFVEAEEASAELEAAEAEFERLEQVMSRFRPTSELSRLNRAGELDASADLADVVKCALDAKASTRGRFDATVHDALVAAGYDRTFDNVPADAPAAYKPARCGGGVAVEGTRIMLDPGTRLDLGGIGKGYAAERVATLLSLAGPCLVSAGGDIAVRSVPSTGTWPVAISDELTVGLTRGGLATSGTERRRWRRNGVEHHHLIDPATGRPAASDLLRVTAIGSDAVDAEVLATSIFIGGLEEALAADAPTVLLTVDGRTVITGGLA